jgi:sulfate permease, SulP family
LILALYFRWKISGIIVVVILAIISSMMFSLNQYEVKIIGEIPKGLPQLLLPNFEIGKIITIAPLAFTLAIISFVESYSISKALESSKGEQLNANQELLALGAANVVGSLFQSYPVSSGFSRSAVNAQSGANTPLAMLISALVVVLALLFFTSVFYFLPIPVLAAIIVVSVVKLIDWRYSIRLFQIDKREFLIFLATIIATIVLGMVAGIISGVVLSIIYLLYRSAYPHIALLGRVKGSHEFRNTRRFSDLEVWTQTIILRMDAPLEFINFQYFRDRIDQEIGAHSSPTSLVMLDASPISHIDASATKGIIEYISSLNSRGIRLIWCDLKGPVRDTIYRNGLIDVIGHENIFLDLNEAVRLVIEHDGENSFDDYAHQSNYKG